MRKLKYRALVVAIFSLAVLALLGFFGWRAYNEGGAWAAYQANGNIYRSGKLTRGVITDREGEVLCSLTQSGAEYSDDGLTRAATLHLIGDTAGNIAYGAVRQFRADLTGWSFTDGVSGEGGTVRLSVSAEAQRAAYSALDDRSGAVAVVNYKTGEIICCATSPGYDPIEAPETLPDGAYLNRAISAAYTPGSVFKLVTMAAAVENIPDLYERDFHCDGEASIGGGKVTCVAKHGDMKIEDAMAKSCNCVFASLAAEMGGEIMHKYADSLGFTSKIDVTGAVIAAGRYSGDKSDDIALAWSGAGQSDDLVVPMTLARYCAAIANGGEINELSFKAGEHGEKTRLLSKSTAERLGEVMGYTVKHSYGEENFPGLRLHAKSGTAEVGGGKKPNSWFCGYIENEGAPYAFAVIIENGGWGISEAADCARNVLNVLI